MGNKHLVWRRRFDDGAGVAVYAIANAGTDENHCGPNAGTHVDDLTCTYIGTDDGHCGPNAGTHADGQL